jgi:hypothetical protein
MAKADNNSSRQQQHARLGSRLQWGWTRAGGKRWGIHGVAMTAAEVEDGSGGRRRWQMTTTATAEDNNGNGGQQKQQTTTALDDNGMQD